eukprot:TRINITY_DN28647_c0_g1_i1.p1 TRINITY_DN28647_c0_g1~~TRINITY_DN28647_c0_g1_i1.p1  ORF type:complete len:226 (+),score=74.15 TRINITY_DN28647_c0_g1_i1:64-741(+)
MKAWYINLACRTDRRERMEKLLERHGIEAERFEALSPADDAVRAILDEYTGADSNLTACGASHRAVWSKIAQEQSPCLVLEDDVALHRDWRRLLDEAVAGMGNGWEMLLLDALQLTGADLSKEGVLVAENCVLADAYVLTPAAAAMMLEWYSEDTWKNHETLMLELQRREKSYTVVPRIAVQLDGLAGGEPTAARSNIQSRKTIDAAHAWYRDVYFKKFGVELYS